jgi:4-hydroxybenzoate polyprenyltransferase
LAFLAFSLTASATYLVNDLWDLGSDRAHPRKRLRPFACARLPIIQGVPVAATLLALALVLGWYISVAFVGILIAYLIMTSIYSALLKDKVLVDVVMLSVLYTIRILAGAVAIGVLPSEWLLAFSVFIFLSLALVKRCSELVSLRSQGKVSTLGRDYWVDDLVVLWPMGVAAAMSSVVVFGLFINSAETHVRYSSPALLWLVAIVLTYWLGRLWIKTARGEMHDDPVIFAAKDQGSQVAIFVMVMIAVLSRFLTIGT